MSICIRANTVDTTDYAAIRATGYQADITGAACFAVAQIAEANGLTAYAYEGEEERFYGSYVPSFGLVMLPAEAQAEILAIFADNAEAEAIVRKAIDHRIQITFTRDCGDSQYRVRLVSELADTVDMNMSSGNWHQFANAIGLELVADKDVDFDAGEVSVANVEKALDDSSTALMFSGEWQRGVAKRLREIVAYAKSAGTDTLVWA